MPRRNISAAATFDVTSLHGEVLTLLGASEVDHYNKAQQRYTTDFTFSVASDLREVDRLVFYETLLFRWQSQLASGRDTDGNLLTAVDERELHDRISKTSALVTQIQKNLRLTLETRSSDQESVGAYIRRLQIAAKEHGIRREKQAGRAIELIHELQSLAGSYLRSTPAERKKLGFDSAEDVLVYIMDVMMPQFHEIDAAYRAGSQRFWIREI